MMAIRQSIPVVLTVLIFLTAAPPSARAGAMLSDLENALMCTCDDKCGKVLVNCTCSTADETRAQFAQMLDSGLTVEQIIQGQVDKHGEKVLSAPTKKGFNLTAWVTPFVALLAGGFGISKILEAWTRRRQKGSRAPEDSADPNPSTSIPSKYSRRLKEELDNIEL
ncbi:MAG: hypothetical protein GWM98_07745 [Nitrospinaceae bacterium]|nr:cytochrome c-type biogenesis protein CcmH [Nitrospinaceae bacterium]NIR54412.1 cytochrome c-type biogenesis protein CcmH [Nitrospinaceae bacterium]NIS84826.1 cytochrome c-type biogenesis protein CcmH [Nitrospinaceae bacterium]NIT81631.1 cytochrome c-type biogenesis protein CcmH [Nitrospinaceae bacterium]NIU43914.1 cytochrome c-type biogenesis protein CcmH [Nitrospinaceae bacterium]